MKQMQMLMQKQMQKQVNVSMTEANETSVKHEANVEARISKKIDILASLLHLLHACCMVFVV